MADNVDLSVVILWISRYGHDQGGRSGRK